jgi:hypothetical protein
LEIFMTHHYAGAKFGFPREDARLNLTDLFAFPKPGDPKKSVIIMNMHPSHGINPPGPTTNEPFAQEALYELRVDTNGDMVADIAYRVRFSKGTNGSWTATVRRAEGSQDLAMGEEGKIIFEGAPVSIGREVQVTQAGEYRMFAGWRSDPFFFDVEGAMNKMQFTGHDWFADKDVCSVALEITLYDLGGGVSLNLWHRSLVLVDGKWVQADRGARPTQTPFMTDAQKDEYLGGEPDQDERFVAMFAHVLEQTAGYTQKGAETAARSLLPDVIPYDPKKNASYPANGRTPRDDSKDVFLTVFNGRLTWDKTGPHSDLLSDFPYLGPPHVLREKLPEKSMVAAPA